MFASLEFSTHLAESKRLIQLAQLNLPGQRRISKRMPVLKPRNLTRLFFMRVCLQGRSANFHWRLIR